MDPGVDVSRELDEILVRHRLRPVAVLLTHGHIDHIFSVTPICGARGIPAWIHPDDADRLADPIRYLSAQLRPMLPAGLTWSEPDDVRRMADGQVLSLAGLSITVDHAPGHTQGSVMFRLPGEQAPQPAPQVCLSGDVLFAGSIGRTDLPGGDHAAMLRSLATKVLTLPDEVAVLPGHGPRTTIGRERASNPYLRGLSGATSAAGPVPAR